eukprot:gnl/TRDRNA2_/TRDRNA2_82958_c0_seq3.p1 gnl/TRDRNA2_/TRDRNA2_82958_c0~~gnl/TRDRNA2_/TRDRNA2_82958_c0_seq3.p1  ORF type:complete len:227 (-),score=32.42 gnl/TRDRNA2_/TRDRNA2_82958_c0_seq3:146-826(-)
MNSLFECCCSLESVPPEEAPTTRRMTAEEEQAAKRTLAIRLPRPPPLMEVVDHTVAAPRASKLLESPLVHEAVSKRFCISNMTPPLDAHQPFAVATPTVDTQYARRYVVASSVRGYAPGNMFDRSTTLVPVPVEVVAAPPAAVNGESLSSAEGAAVCRRRSAPAAFAPKHMSSLTRLMSAPPRVAVEATDLAAGASVDKSVAPVEAPDVAAGLAHSQVEVQTFSGD